MVVEVIPYPSCTHRLEMNMGHQFLQVGVSINRNGLAATVELVPDTLLTPVDPTNVGE